MGADELTDTGSHKVRDELGRNWRTWVWVQRQFSPVSLGTIFGVIVACGGYVAHLNSKWDDEHIQREKLETRVIVLETRVIPMVQSSGRIDTLEDRVTRLEEDYRIAQEEAGKPPVPRRRRP